jgi:hypothetical protein
LPDRATSSTEIGLGPLDKREAPPVEVEPGDSAEVTRFSHIDRDIAREPGQRIGKVVSRRVVHEDRTGTPARIFDEAADDEAPFRDKESAGPYELPVRDVSIRRDARIIRAVDAQNRHAGERSSRTLPHEQGQVNLPAMQSV